MSSFTGKSISLRICNEIMLGLAIVGEMAEVWFWNSFSVKAFYASMGNRASATEYLMANTLISKIQEFGEDVLSLDVTTIESDIELKFSTGQQKPKTLKDLFKVIEAKVAPSSSGTVAAMTHVRLDQDTVMIVGKGANPALLEQHQQVVQDATDARLAMVKMVGELFS